MAIGDVLAAVQLGDKDSDWFYENPDLVLLKGQIVFLEGDSGTFKKGDNVTTLESLPWLGAGGTVDSVTGTANRITISGTAADRIVNIASAYDTAITNEIALADAAVYSQVQGDLVNYATLSSMNSAILSGSTPPIWSGQWRNGFLGSTFNTGLGWINFIYTCPYLVGSPHTVSQIRWPVTTGVGASTIRLAIYDDLNGYPNNLVQESGTLDSSSNGELAFTFSPAINLTGKLYHLALQVSSNSVAGRYWTGGVSLLPRPSAGTPFFSYSLAQAYGTFPSTFTAGATKANIGVQPMLSLLVS